MKPRVLADQKQQFADYVVEQMAGVGWVRARRMFGGHGIYIDGLMFALIADEQLYFKSDPLTVDHFKQRGLRPFTYSAKGREVALAYYEAPSEVFEEAETMAQWTRRAFECALRARKPVARAGKAKRTKS